MKQVGIISSSRADYSALRPLIRALDESSKCEKRLMVSGTHLAASHGETVWEIEQDGFDIAEKVVIDLDDDSAAGVARSMGQATTGFAGAFEKLELDLIVVLGDRFEIHAAVSAAVPFFLPVAHIHGGELSEGSMDDRFRHSITKLSHLHFVAHEKYAQRIAQMGEQRERITVSGAPSLDNLRSIQMLDRRELSADIGLDLSSDPILVTFHPPTNSPDERSVSELIEGIANWSGPIVFTAPNADPGNQVIRKEIANFALTNPNAILVEDLGPQRYFSLMTIAAAMVGNSSSGIIEAPSFSLPVINVGARQNGRVRGENVVDVPLSAGDISAALRKATSSAFKADLDFTNPFGDGKASERIVRRIENEPLGDLLSKTFQDLEAPGA